MRIILGTEDLYEAIEEYLEKRLKFDFGGTLIKTEYHELEVEINEINEKKKD